MTLQLASDQPTAPANTTTTSVVWMGARTGGLKWLRAAIDRHCLTSDIPSDSKTNLVDQLESEIEQLSTTGAQRLIIGTSNRLHLDTKSIHRLQELAGEIPLAIAGDSWLDGLRRTGVGETGVLLLPWSRWWDGWGEWLGKPTESTMGAWTTATAHLTAPESECQICDPRGLVIADCWQTGQGWKRACPEPLSVQNVENISSRRLPTWRGTPDWILLDDTADLIQADKSNGPLASVRQLRIRFPEALLIVATTICRHDQWLPLQEIARCETIAKPSTGRSLRNILRLYFGQQATSTSCT